MATETETAIISMDTPALTKGEQRHLTALEKRIATGLQTFREVGAALLEIRDARLYRESHSTFAAYCTERWAMPQSRAYQLMDSAKVVQVLGDPKALENEAQARAMAPLVDHPADAKKVWAAAQARAEETDQPMTAALISRVREEVLPTANGHKPTETPTTRLMAEIIRVAASYQRWKASKPNVGERTKVKAAVTKLLSVVS